MGGQTPHLFISWCPCSDLVTELQGPGVLAYFASCAKIDPLAPQEERVGRESCCPGAGQLNRAKCSYLQGPSPLELLPVPSPLEVPEACSEWHVRGTSGWQPCPTY